MDHRPPVGHFHVGNRLLHEAIEARGRAAGIDKVVAAAGWIRSRTLSSGQSQGMGFTTGFAGSVPWPC